jgi:hypothetical protein
VLLRVGKLILEDSNLKIDLAVKVQLLKQILEIESVHFSNLTELKLLLFCFVF